MLSTSPPLLGSFGGVVSSSECSSDGASHSFGSVRVHAHFGFNVRALPVPPARSMPSNSPFMNCVGKYNGGISHAGQGPLKVVHGFSPVSTLTPPGTSDIGANPSSVDRGTPAYHKSTSSPRNQRASHQTNSVSSEPFSADSFLGDVLTTTERDRRWSAQSLLNAPGVGMDLQASPFPLPCVRDHVSNALASEVDQGPISSEKSTWTHHDFHQWGVKEHAEGMSALVEQKHDAALSPLQGILQSPIHGVVGNSARAGLLKLQLSRNSSEISLSEASIPRKISRSDAPPSPGASCPLLATATEVSALCCILIASHCRKMSRSSLVAGRFTFFQQKACGSLNLRACNLWNAVYEMKLPCIDSTAIRKFQIFQQHGFVFRDKLELLHLSLQLL